MSSVKRPMTQPINLIFSFLQNKTPVEIWMYEDTDTKMEGQIIGFDEYMNLVLESAAEVNMKKDTRKELGRAMVKGDAIVLICKAGD